MNKARRNQSTGPHLCMPIIEAYFLLPLKRFMTVSNTKREKQIPCLNHCLCDFSFSKILFSYSNSFSLWIYSFYWSLDFSFGESILSDSISLSPSEGGLTFVSISTLCLWISLILMSLSKSFNFNCNSSITTSSCIYSLLPTSLFSSLMSTLLVSRFFISIAASA